MTRPVTWASCARINATRWGLVGAVFGPVATGAAAWRERAR